MTASAWIRQQALGAAADGFSQSLPRLQAPPLRTPPAKLTCRACIALTREQLEAVEEHARACGLTVSFFIRQLLLGHKPITRQPQIRSAIVAVNRVSANLSQLVELASDGARITPDLIHTVSGVLEQIHVLRDALLRTDAADGRTGPSR